MPSDVPDCPDWAYCALHEWGCRRSYWLVAATRSRRGRRCGAGGGPPLQPRPAGIPASVSTRPAYLMQLSPVPRTSAPGFTALAHAGQVVGGSRGQSAIHHRVNDERLTACLVTPGISAISGQAMPRSPRAKLSVPRLPALAWPFEGRSRAVVGPALGAHAAPEAGRMIARTLALTCADCTNGGGGSGGRSAHVPDHHLSGLG